VGLIFKGYLDLLEPFFILLIWCTTFHLPPCGTAGLCATELNKYCSCHCTCSRRVSASELCHHRDPDKLEKWAHVNLIKFNKAKGRDLHMGQGNPLQQYRLVDEGIESSPEEKDWGVLADENLDVSHQYALATRQANRALGCIPSSVGSRAREGILPLCPALQEGLPPGVLRPALKPSAQDRAGAVGAGPEEAPAMIRGLQPLCWEDRLRELGLFSLGKRRL